jgi:hypothetical protein
VLPPAGGAVVVACVQLLPSADVAMVVACVAPCSCQGYRMTLANGTVSWSQEVKCSRVPTVKALLQ